MTLCIPQLTVDFHQNRPVDISFDAPELSSDAGFIPLRYVDDRLGLSRWFSELLPDMCIPLKAASDSGGKAASDSDGWRPPIPTEGGHPGIVDEGVRIEPEGGLAVNSFVLDFLLSFSRTHTSSSRRGCGQCG